MNKSTLSALVVALMLGSGIAVLPDRQSPATPSIDRRSARTATTMPALPHRVRACHSGGLCRPPRPGEAFRLSPPTSIDSSKPEGEA